MNILSEVEDRISSLPDDLLCQILSFIPTLNAVRTSALSKRWRHVWRSVETLHFDDLQWRNSRDSMADQILCQNSKTIQKLHLHCTRVEYDTSRIAALLARKIRELDISIPMCLPPSLIQFLGDSETLEVLKIRCCDFTIHASTSSAGFQRLKVLHLMISSPDPVSMQTLFRSCHVLEELVLDCCIGSWKTTLEIFVPTLKRLSIRFQCSLCCELDVMAPALECLDIADNEFSQYKIGDMPRLNKAKVHVGLGSFGKANNPAMQLLDAVANTTSLSLSAITMWILSSSRGINLPLLPNLTHLEVQVFHGFSWNLLIEFLDNSPKLEILVLMRKDFLPCSLFASSWTPQQFAPSCLLFHVKVIKIVGFKGQPDELELLEYLLKNANVMENLIIDSRKLDAQDATFKNLFIHGVKSQI